MSPVRRDGSGTGKRHTAPKGLMAPARRPLRTLFAIVLLSAAAPVADAAGQVRLSLAGGPSVPLGALADDFDKGWHAQVSAGVAVPMLPVSLRIDGAVNRFPEEGGNFRTISGSVNALVRLPVPLISPYLVGGVGVYSSRVSHDETGHEHDEGATSNVGANLGLGLRLGLPGLSLFAEARLHNLFSDAGDTRFAPLSVGLRF